MTTSTGSAKVCRRPALTPHAASWLSVTGVQPRPRWVVCDLHAPWRRGRRRTAAVAGEPLHRRGWPDLFDDLAAVLPRIREYV